MGHFILHAGIQKYQCCITFVHALFFLFCFSSAGSSANYPQAKTDLEYTGSVSLHILSPSKSQGFFQYFCGGGGGQVSILKIIGGHHSICEFFLFSMHNITTATRSAQVHAAESPPLPSLKKP